MIEKASSLVLLLLFRTVFTWPLTNICPAGHIAYGSLCCVPVVEPNFCGADHKIKRCLTNGTQDECVPCEKGKYNSHDNKTSWSDFSNECFFYPKDCPEESVPSEELSADCGYCECDEARGFTGSDPCDCQKVPECGNNTYLKNGHCVACPAGTFREGLGYGPCVVTTTSMISLKTQGEEASSTFQTTISVPKISITSTMGSNITGIGKNTRVIPELQESVQSDGIRPTVIYPPIIIAVVLSVFLIVIVLLFFIAKKFLMFHKGSVCDVGGQAAQHGMHEELPQDTTHHGAIDAPPLYHDHSFASGRVLNGEMQGAVPFYDHESPRWPTLHSEESIPSTSSGTGSQNNPNDADRTSVKKIVRSHGSSIQESHTPCQLMGGNNESSVIICESLESEPFLRSAPNLDPRSVENDSH